VAVTVQCQTPLVVLDEGDRIVGVGPGAESRFGPLVGEVVWDCHPGSEPLFKPYYETARETGETVEFVQFYDGYVTQVRAVPREDGRLELYWERLARLDTLTIDGLLESLEQALDALDAHTAPGRNGARRALTLIQGGA
jgi:hypothetical protein